MPRKLPKYVVADVDRHGQLRLYFRVKGRPKTRMPSDVESQDFKDAYASVMAGDVTTIRDTQPKLQPRHRGLLGYVYFIRTASAVKIGFSSQPGARLTGLKVGIPDPIKSIVMMRGYMSDEKALHLRFDAFRRDGEWFTPTSEILRAMAQAATYGKVLSAKKRTDQVPLPSLSAPKSVQQADLSTETTG